MALVIGLTGSIGSGKSTVAHYFSELGVPVIDADSIAKELCCSGHQVFAKIVERFGNSILEQNGEIDRKKLRKIIFTDTTERIWLEDILHPLIIEEILNRIRNLSADYCVIVVPLLFETSMKNYINRVLVVDVNEEEQIHRAHLRDKENKNDIKAILSKQLSREEKVKLADDVILNDASFEELEKKVTDLHQFYVKLARRIVGNSSK